MTFEEKSPSQFYEKKHDYHIMLKPTLKKEAQQKAIAKEQSLSSYIEKALWTYMNNPTDI
ncbi:hypothetical protein [Weissella minor]|uniref:hypothetical protein n=1 Tax=Weissella minor TaxID=1620 RepID=UPI003AF297AD